MLELEKQMAAPDFWDNPTAAQAVINESNTLKSMVEQFQQLFKTYEDLEVSYELVKEEADAELRRELEDELEQLTEALNEFELTLLLSGIDRILTHINQP